MSNIDFHAFLNVGIELIKNHAAVTDPASGTLYRRMNGVGLESWLASRSTLAEQAEPQICHWAVPVGQSVGHFRSPELNAQHGNTLSRAHKVRRPTSFESANVLIITKGVTQGGED